MLQSITISSIIQLLRQTSIRLRLAMANGKGRKYANLAQLLTTADGVDLNLLTSLKNQQTLRTFATMKLNY